MRKLLVAALTVVAASASMPTIANTGTSFRFYEYEFYYDAAKTQYAGWGFGQCGLHSEVVNALDGVKTSYYSRTVAGECRNGIAYWY